MCGKFAWKTNQDFCNRLFQDGYFILNYIVSNVKPGEKVPTVLLNGGKILFIKFNNVIIKDSINFIPMALAKLPKTFDLKELKKGYFSHFFNIDENQNYIGKYNIMDIQYYGAELSSKNHDKFIEWHKEKKGV